MITDHWYIKRTDVLKEYASSLTDSSDVVNNDPLKWKAWYIDKLSPTWDGWKPNPAKWIYQNPAAKMSYMMGFANMFNSRYKIQNPICILCSDYYWVHPGTTRYYLNQVCKDFDLSAVVIDLTGYNEESISNNFSSMVPYEADLDISYTRQGNTFYVKGTSIKSDSQHYQNEFDIAKTMVDLDYAIDVWYKDKHFFMVDNGQPTKSYRVENMKGLAQLSIHLLCDPDYNFEEILYERR